MYQHRKFQLEEFYQCTYLGSHETGNSCHKIRPENKMMLFSDLLDLDYGKERILVKDLTPICKK